jgi:hypothetical protein
MQTATSHGLSLFSPNIDSEREKLSNFLQKTFRITAAEAVNFRFHPSLPTVIF